MESYGLDVASDKHETETRKKAGRKQLVANTRRKTRQITLNFSVKNRANFVMERYYKQYCATNFLHEITLTI